MLDMASQRRAHAHQLKMHNLTSCSVKVALQNGYALLSFDLTQLECRSKNTSFWAQTLAFPPDGFPGAGHSRRTRYPPRQAEPYFEHKEDGEPSRRLPPGF